MVVSFRDLEVWQESMDLVTECYDLTRGFPLEERYGLTSQIRRAACSIPSNLAEGHSRPTAVYANHVSIALGSHAELDTDLEIAERLGMVSGSAAAAVRRRMDRVGRMLHALDGALERRLRTVRAARS